MNSAKEIYLTCKDYTVSNKKFDLLYNSEFDMLETSPQPKGEELASFYESSAYISHTDSKKSILDKVYQIVKKYALKNKLKLINSFKVEEKKLLDIGCGTGEFLLTCKNGGWNVVGVEPNNNARDLAKIKLSDSEISKLFSDIDNVSSEKFDVITMWHVLEHVPNLEGYIFKLKSLLKPNGVLVVAVPNFKSYDAIYYKEFWAAFDVPRHLWHFSKIAIQILFSKQNLKVYKILPMKFDSFYVSLLSEKYRKSKSIILKAFFIGCKSNLKALRTKEYSSLVYFIKNT